MSDESLDAVSPSSPSDAGSAAAGPMMRIGAAVLALLAYLPALLSSPGRMPADTKLYLYLDPADLTRRASSTFEPDQFAGWVPHQQITYLWPSGPWFWVFDTVGVPDWIAHRLWIGTIMFAAGAGVLWLASKLGLSSTAAVAAALVYQLSPFMLPYISRTSLLLLPWAGLGWIVGLTVVGARSGRWREPALIALVVATVGSPNATALALIAPAPCLWLLHVAREVPRRDIALFLARTTGLCVLISLWWGAMLIVQSRHGAPVLAYSETLADVSNNATGSEVLRGLGYWLFYVRDVAGPTTTASLDYLVSTRGIVVSYLVVLVGFVGLAFSSWKHRRFAGLLLIVGAMLAVGVHPIESPSPFMRLVVGDDQSGLALALRSSTRALPLLLLALALGTAMLVDALPAVRQFHPRVSIRTVGAVAVGVLTVLNLPALWTADLVDGAIDRDADPPAAWREAAAALDAAPEGFRVLQVPGAEFGAYRWGFTVDQPLVGLTDRPVVTRDLLPLGSGPAMDLLYAFDDRIQAGVFEPAALEPISRLFGADRVWLANDSAFDRFRTARPEPLDAAVRTLPLLVEDFGEPIQNTPDLATLDPAAIASVAVGRPISPVALATIDNPEMVLRTKTDTVVISGSGDGVVDAAAAGLIDGTEVLRYSASGTSAADGPLSAMPSRVIITDSNRDRAHHWRGSQDVVGHTEPGGPGIDVLTPTSGDQRLAVFGSSDIDTQSIAVQRGPVTAIASAYGEPFAYTPEHRAVMAIDGDPTTAWLVGEHGDPIGERIEITTSEATASVIMLQPPPGDGGRVITHVRITEPASSLDLVVELTDASWFGEGQPVEFEPVAAGETITFRIDGVTAGVEALATSRQGVGFAELDLGLGDTDEFIRVPIDATTGSNPVSTDVAATYLFTRLRTDPTNPWRDDTEPEIRRLFDTRVGATFNLSATIRLDQRAAEQTIAAALDRDVDDVSNFANRSLTGAPRFGGFAATDGDLATAWVTPFDGAIGAQVSMASTGPLGSANAQTFSIVQPEGPYSRITKMRISDGTASFEIAVPEPDASGRSTMRAPRTLVPGRLELTVIDIAAETTIDRRFGDTTTLPVAIAEFEATGAVDAQRHDPNLAVSVTCDPSHLEVDGRAIPISFSTSVGELLDGAPVAATACETVVLDVGSHSLRSIGRRASGFTVDRIVISEATSPDLVSAPRSTIAVERNDARHRTAVVDDCRSGCWLVLGEGFNEAWSASIDGDSLGPPQLVDGGFNGWWLDPADEARTVAMRWTAQRPVTLGLIVSAITALLCCGIFAASLRRRTAVMEPDIALPSTDGRPVRPVVAAAVLLAAGAAFIGPGWGLLALAAFGFSVAAERFTGRPLPVLGGLGIALVAGIAARVVLVERRDAPAPNSGWTDHVDHLHGWSLLAVLLIGAGTMLRRNPR